jgi:hypothetical protein
LAPAATVVAFQATNELSSRRASVLCQRHRPGARLIIPGGVLVKRNLWALSIVSLLAVGAVLLLRHNKLERPSMFRFVDNGSREKNFDAFPPEIPEYEFDEADFFS